MSGPAAAPRMLASRIYTLRPGPPLATDLTRLRELGTCRLADVMGGGLMSRELLPVYEPIAAFVGTAVTLRITPGDFRMVPWGVDQLGTGDVLVIDGAGHRDRAVWGDFVSSRAAAVGCAGVIVDGATRDTLGIERLRLPVYARARAPLGPTRTGRGDVNVPVSCGGVSVLPGDVVVADADGIVVVPLADVSAVLPLAEGKLRREPSTADIATAPTWPSFLRDWTASWEGPETFHRGWR